MKQLRRSEMNTSTGFRMRHYRSLNLSFLELKKKNLLQPFAFKPIILKSL